MKFQWVLPIIKMMIDSIFSSFPELELVYQYGSSLKDKQKAKDIDFGILLNKGVSAERYLEIYNDLTHKLSKIFKKEIDIACLNKSSPMLAYQILKKGRLIYGDIRRAKQFIVEAMTRYFDYLPLHQFFVKHLERRLDTHGR